MADAVDKLVDMEAEIDDLVDRLIDSKREVIGVIEAVDSPIQYDVLHMKYIQYMTLQEIADHYHREYEWAKSTHRRGLQNVSEILRKREEPP